MKYERIITSTMCTFFGSVTLHLLHFPFITRQQFNLKGFHSLVLRDLSHPGSNHEAYEHIMIYFTITSYLFHFERAQQRSAQSESEKWKKGNERVRNSEVKCICA